MNKSQLEELEILMDEFIEEQREFKDEHYASDKELYGSVLRDFYKWIYVQNTDRDTNETELKKQHISELLVELENELTQKKEQALRERQWGKESILEGQIDIVKQLLLVYHITSK